MNKPVREGFVEDKPVDIDDVAETAAKAAPAAEPPQEDAPVVPEWPVIIKLRHKPLQKSRSELLTELTFREPTAADIMRCGGNPVRVEVLEVAQGMAQYHFVINDQKMMNLMAQLSGVLQPILERMDPRDYNSCAYRLQRFFAPEQGIW